MTRRRALVLGSAGVGATLTGGLLLPAVSAPSAPAPDWAPLALDLGGGLRVTALRTGGVAVKAAHCEFGGSQPLALPAILADLRWTGWLPITAWLVEHPDGPILVDTGETPRVAEAGYFGCDSGTQFFYERMLQFDVPRGVGEALRAHGVPPEEVRTVALTHLHSDHVGGLVDLPNATVWMSRTEIERPPAGALPCRWPDGFDPTPTDFSDGPAGAFEVSHALMKDGAVRLVPTPGHTRGHLSVCIEGPEGAALLAGDASFSLDQVERRAVAGICADREAARRTLDVIAEHLAETGASYHATHAPPGDA